MIGACGRTETPIRSTLQDLGHVLIRLRYVRQGTVHYSKTPPSSTANRHAEGTFLRYFRRIARHGGGDAPSRALRGLHALRHRLIGRVPPTAKKKPDFRRSSSRATCAFSQDSVNPRLGSVAAHEPGPRPVPGRVLSPVPHACDNRRARWGAPGPAEPSSTFPVETATQTTHTSGQGPGTVVAVH